MGIDDTLVKNTRMFNFEIGSSKSRIYKISYMRELKKIKNKTYLKLKKKKE